MSVMVVIIYEIYYAQVEQFVWKNVKNGNAGC